jgi:hypothetical protein
MSMLGTDSWNGGYAAIFGVSLLLSPRMLGGLAAGGGGCLPRGVAGPPAKECLAQKPTLAACRRVKDEATLLDDNARNTAFPDTFTTDFKWAEGGALVAGCLVGEFATIEVGFFGGCAAGAGGTSQAQRYRAAL